MDTLEIMWSLQFAVALTSFFNCFKPKLHEQFSMEIFYLLVQMGPYDNFLFAPANRAI